MNIIGLLGYLAASTSDFSGAALNFSQTAAGLLLSAVWQGAVIAGCLALCLRLAPRTTATLRFVIWAAGFLAVAGLPFLPLALAHWTAAASGNEFNTHSALSKPLFLLDIRWSIALTGLWVTASFMRGVTLIADSLRLRKLWRSAIPIEVNLRHQESLVVPGRRPVQLCTTQELERPAVIGFLAPRILIPDWLMAKLTPGELDQIVLHETEHLRRGDDWTNLLQKLSLVIFPLNPVLLWIERRLCKEREMACDDGVVRVTKAPRAYAACLAGLAERGLQHRSEALSLGAWQRRPELVLRVHSILRRTPKLGPIATRSLAAVVGCSLIFGSVELARCPQLVAFVPMQETVAQVHIPAVLPQGMQMENVAFNTTQPGAVAQAPAPPRLAASSRKLKSAASVSTRPDAESKQSEIQPGKLSSGEAAFAEPVKFNPDQAAQLASSDSRAAAPQSWMVLSMYQQMNASGQLAAYAYVASAPSAEEDSRDDQAGRASRVNLTVGATIHPSAKESVKTTHRVSASGLIFRVLPDGSLYPLPAAAVVPTRNGWFVIQL